MAIKWKSPDRFKPDLVLRRIESLRTVNNDGTVSFAGLELDECLPTLQSMLKFPEAAAEIEKETLVWLALSRLSGNLTPDALLSALNSLLREKLTTREIDYVVLTSISLDPEGFQKRFTVLNCDIELRPNGYPRKFRSHVRRVTENLVSVPDTPNNYCKILAKVRSKSDGGAYHKAMQAIDLLRSILCLLDNLRMQFTFARPCLDPINVIRPGSSHTVHLSDGTSSSDGFWFEPDFTPTRPHKFKKPQITLKNLRWAFRCIEKSTYKDELISALLRFVRALDQSDPNIAFLRLWSALEALTTPESASYDKLIQRSAFLFRDHAYHKQVLEHLRERRNSNVHSGEESENARIHCFQLQAYFRQLAWFHLRYSCQFTNLREAIQVLDLPPDLKDLQRRQELVKQAIILKSPK